jgi:hypothetical protein
MKPALLAIPVTALLLAGCGSSGEAPALDSAARLRLQSDVLAVARAAANHDRAAGTAALADLRSDLAALTKTQAVSAARAAEISAVIARLEPQVAALPVPRTTLPASTVVSTVVVQAPAPAPRPPASKQDQSRNGGDHNGNPGDGGKHHGG